MQIQRRVCGITPAYAGKSPPSLSCARLTQDHPRACGEKALAVERTPGAGGSPPRMRGKGCKRHLPRRGHGITPAHAGKSLLSCSLSLIHWDHPRACGEKSKAACAVVIGLGSPPRMRGKALLALPARMATRITPAHAGKSPSYILFRCVQPGSPPRMRGKEPVGGIVAVSSGITPAHAGRSCRRCRDR